MTQNEILIVGNWKMNPATMGMARKLFLDTRDRVGKGTSHVQVVVAPPVPYLSELSKLSPTGRVTLAVQDAYFEEGGAFTGEISFSMVKSVGARYAILGHSERRAHGETDAVVAQKVAQVLKQKGKVILCVGESKRDKSGNYFTEVETQLGAALASVPKSAIANLVIAYEPVWAIGTGVTPAPADIYEMKLFIQKVLADTFGRTAIAKVAILYGGSVDSKNAEGFLVEGQVDGFLVGGASLRATEFGRIIDLAKTHGRRKTA